MCGIVAVVMKGKAGFFKAEEDAFFQMLYADALRGDDSTGIISIEKDSTFHISKEASEPTMFIPAYRDSKVGKIMFNAGRAMIGHNRKKTIGAIEDATAHPFVVDDEFAMVHNGTLYNHEALAKGCKVDSEALAIHLKKAFDKDDVAAALEESLGEVRGAYATGMYHQDKDTIYFVRNKERPLAYVETDRAFFFASEGGLLYWILTRNGLWTKDSHVTPVKEDTLVSIALATGTLASKELAVKKATPPATKLTVVGGTNTKSFSNKPSLSKNRFKKLRRQILGMKIEWWCDDYIETNFPRTEKEGEVLFTLMGSSDDIETDHIIVAPRVNKEVFNLKEADDALYEKWYGRIDEVTFSPKSGQICVHMVEVAPLPFSTKKKSVDIIDAAYIQRKLDEAETNSTTVH